MIAPGSVEKLEGLVRRHADRIKALLVLVVAADHNDWFRELSPALFEPLTFHVLGFLLLAFTFGEKTLSWRFVIDRIARYLIPYWWVLTVASAALFVLFKPQSASVANSVLAWFLAAFLGNAPFVKSASGFMMLWFLPCLFGLTCLIAIADSLSERGYQWFVWALAVAAHLALPLVPSRPLFLVPFGLAVAFDVFLLGLLWRRLLPFRLPRYWGPMVLAIFVLSYGYLVAGPIHLEIATLEMAGIDNPLVMVLQDVAGFAGILTVIWLAGMLRKASWLDALGRHSLLVYLLHPFAYQALGKFVILIPPAKAGLGSVALFAWGSVAACIAVAAAFAVAAVVSRSAQLSAWIIPRSWSQWPPSGFLLGKA